jgi:hypothetical protein
MPKYKIRTSQFCTLSKESKWQAWLQTVSQDLHDELVKFIQTSNSCRANHDKMMEVYKKLEKRNLSSHLVKFLRKEYPHTIDEVKEITDPLPPKTPSKLVAVAGPTEVFKYYNPNILTFPHKIIFENDNPDDLRREVSRFLVGKVGGDFIIIANRAYVEYFLLKYGRENKDLPQNMREIVQYRAKKGLLPGTHILQENIKQEPTNGSKVQKAFKANG